MNEQDHAERIVRQLDRGFDNLRPGTLYRLRLAREAALARVDPGRPALVPGGWELTTHRRILIPVFALIIGLSGLLFWQQHQIARPLDNAEIDAQVLTDELPVTAYLDTGFEVWLYHHSTE